MGGVFEVLIQPAEIRVIWGSRYLLFSWVGNRFGLVVS